MDTLTMHRLRLPPSLRRNLATTNLIESAFSTVETVCRNVKRWQHGDRTFAGAQRGLLWAESRWNRIHGLGATSGQVRRMNIESFHPGQRELNSQPVKAYRGASLHVIISAGPCRWFK